MAGDQVGRINKGPRRAVSVRVPEEHFALYRREAKRLSIPVADYVAVRIAICEDLPIPAPFFAAHPGLIRMYDVEAWPGILAGLPTDVAARVRRELGDVAKGSRQMRQDLKRLEALEEESAQTG